MSKTHTCPRCGEAASGNFCANCGASLGGRFCNQCGSRAEPGARFCNECGAGLSTAEGDPSAGAGTAGAKTPGTGKKPGGGARVGAQAARAAASGGGGNAGMGWWVAGGMLVVVIFFMVLPLLTQDEQQPSAPNAPFAQGAAGAAPATTDLSSMTPREAADRLYERVMRAAAANNSDEVTMFLPMSIQAYDIARPLDADGLFHLSRLQRMAARDTDALNTAVEGLEENPDHLLNLYAAGDAALALGREDAARQYLSRLLQAWDGEIDSGNTDYQLHRDMMPEVRAFAERNVGG